MRWYTPVPPPDDLRGRVACGWTAAVEGEHRLVPDGCIDLLWLDTGSLWVCGPETRAWTFSLPPGLRAVGVRFLPGAAAPVLGVRVDELTNRRIRLDDVLSPRMAAGLSDRIGHQPTDRGRLDVLLDAARRWQQAAPDPDPLATRSVQRPFTVAGLAEEFGITPRQLHRRSVHAFGYGASTLGRLLRFQRFAAASATAPTIAAAAARAGYTDQSHLVRDCRDITGDAPSTFLATWFPTFPEPDRPDTSDPYKSAIAPEP